MIPEAVRGLRPAEWLRDTLTTDFAIGIAGNDAVLREVGAGFQPSRVHVVGTVSSRLLAVLRKIDYGLRSKRGAEVAALF